VVVALAIAAAALVSCSATSTTNGAADVSVSLVQERPDVSKNQLAIKVKNRGENPLTIARATLASTYFEVPLVWAGESPSTVLPGRALDLRVAIPGVLCDADSPGAAVTLELADAVVELVPTDPYDLVERLHRNACHVSTVAAVAALTAERLVNPPSLPAAAELVVSVQPTGATGVIVLESVLGTTLLSPSSGGVGLPELVLDQSISAEGPLEVRIPIVPNRCDAHALAEDKVGTRIPLIVTAADGTTGRITLAASDDLREQMYSYYSAYCEL